LQESKWSKYVGGRGLAPDLAGGAYGDFPAGIRGGEGERKRKGRNEERRGGNEEKGRGEEGWERDRGRVKEGKGEKGKGRGGRRKKEGRGRERVWPSIFSS